MYPFHPEKAQDGREQEWLSLKKEKPPQHPGFYKRPYALTELSLLVCCWSSCSITQAILHVTVAVAVHLNRAFKSQLLLPFTEQF